MRGSCRARRRSSRCCTSSTGPNGPTTSSTTRRSSLRLGTDWSGPRSGAAGWPTPCGRRSAGSAPRPRSLIKRMYHQIARNKRNSIIVVSLFLIVWILAGFVIGLFGGSTSDAIIGAVILGLLGVGAALFSYYYGASTVLSAAGAREADPRLYQQLYNIVQTLAIGDGLPVPKVYIIDDPSPNAFATARHPH